MGLGVSVERIRELLDVSLLPTKEETEEQIERLGTAMGALTAALLDEPRA